MAGDEAAGLVITDATPGQGWVDTGMGGMGCRGQRRRQGLNIPGSMSIDLGSPTSPGVTMSSRVRRTSLGLASLIGLVALAGCSESQPAEAPSDPVPASFTINGSVSIAGSSFNYEAKNGDACKELLDAEPIGSSQVLLTDDGGKTLAVANLPVQGVIVPSDLTSGPYGLCAYNFTFENVAEGLDFYTISLGNMGKMTYSRADLDEPLELSVG